MRFGRKSPTCEVQDHLADLLDTPVGGGARPGRIFLPFHVRVSSVEKNRKRGLKTLGVHNVYDPPDDLNVLLRHRPPSIAAPKGAQQLLEASR